MRSKIYSLITICFLFAIKLTAQTVVLSNGFDGYNGLPATVASGWYYSWNDSASSAKSFYDTLSGAQYYGINSPSYKFGKDSVTIISPAFTGADSVSFWFKGNGVTAHDTNTFYVYVSADSITWSELWSRDSIPTGDADTIGLSFSNSIKYFKFFYRKYQSGLNVGLDDINVFNTSVGITEKTPSDNLLIYPNPSLSGIIHINYSNLKSISEIFIYDMLGNVLKEVNIKIDPSKDIMVDYSKYPKGVYFLKLKIGEEYTVRKIVKG